MADDKDTPENWKPVVGFEELYEVSDKGRVRSLGREVAYQRTDGFLFRRTYPAKVLALGIRGSGYRCVTLSKFRNAVPYQVHRLVCEAFHGPPFPLAQAAHLNGNKTDNRATNLVWASAKENCGHKRRHGTHMEGANHPRARLSESDVHTIRRRKASGERASAIATDYGVGKCAINSIAARRCWRNI